jgi:hypothetical protein
MLPFHWLTQTLAFGLGITFSPITIALVSLLLLGARPLRRCCTFLAGWVLANGGAQGLVVAMGGRLSWAAQLGSRGQILMDLIGAGALLGLGLFQLTPAVAMGEENWALQLMGRLPELGGMLLTSQTGLRGDLDVGAVFVAIATSLLLLPPLLWLVSGEQLRAPLTALNDWLVHRAEWLVGGVRPGAWPLPGLAGSGGTAPHDPADRLMQRRRRAAGLSRSDSGTGGCARASGW